MSENFWAFLQSFSAELAKLRPMCPEKHFEQKQNFQKNSLPVIFNW